MRARLAVLLAAIAALLSAEAASGAPVPVPQPPGQYLLGLGDSLTFGYQPWRFVFDASSFHTGFVDDLGTYLSVLRPGIEVVNEGCPGETTTSFIEGGCTYHRFLPLHEDYPAGVPQLDQALAFLRAHPGEVSPIVVSIGANDVNDLAGDCNRDIPCVSAALPGLLAQVRANLETILGALDAAAPSATVILLEYYDPYAAADPRSVDAVLALNATIADAARAHGDLTADAFTPFNVTPPQPDRLCALTFACGLLPDIHPTDDGYLVIATRMYVAAGYPLLAARGLGG
jgi:lysophospholipase L1-like esterase